MPLRRVLFISINIAMIAAVYVSFVHPWIESRHANNERIRQLQQTIGRFKAIVEKEESVKAMIARAQASPATNEFWNGPGEAAISAALQARLRDLSEASDIRLRTLRGLPVADLWGAKSLTIRIEANGTYGALLALLAAIETETPFLFVTNLNLRQSVLTSPSGPQSDPTLELQLDVSGLVREGGA
jgi:general secretion pathway protein M